MKLLAIYPSISIGYILSLNKLHTFVYYTDNSIKSYIANIIAYFRSDKSFGS